MDFQPLNAGSGGFSFFVVVAGLLGVVSTVFWMIVGWRAMRAHEQLAKATAEMASRGDRADDAA